eukprot:6755331-Prymnesium_polylepis.1
MGCGATGTHMTISTRPHAFYCFTNIRQSEGSTVTVHVSLIRVHIPAGGGRSAHIAAAGRGDSIGYLIPTRQHRRHVGSLSFSKARAGLSLLTS